MLMKMAYEQYVDKAMTDDDAGASADAESNDFIPLPFDEWLKQLCVSQLQADYWFKSMELDLLILQVRQSCHVLSHSMFCLIWIVN